MSSPSVGSKCHGCTVVDVFGDEDEAAELEPLLLNKGVNRGGKALCTGSAGWKIGSCGSGAGDEQGVISSSLKEALVVIERRPVVVGRCGVGSMAIEDIVDEWFCM